MKLNELEEEFGAELPESSLEERCEICGQPGEISVKRKKFFSFFGGLRPHFGTGLFPTIFKDHSHRTGKERGWLCNRCNAGLGFFLDSREMLLRAYLYLRKYKEGE